MPQPNVSSARSSHIPPQVKVLICCGRCCHWFVTFRFRLHTMFPSTKGVTTQVGRRRPSSVPAVWVWRVFDFSRFAWPSARQNFEFLMKTLNDFVWLSLEKGGKHRTNERTNERDSSAGSCDGSYVLCVFVVFSGGKGRVFRTNRSHLSFDNGLLIGWRSLQQGWCRAGGVSGYPFSWVCLVCMTRLSGIG